MLAHNVYFTLEDAAPERVDALLAGCRKYLESHPGVVFFGCGRRSPGLERDVNDQDFHVGLHVIFDGRESHDRYQVHELHEKFIAEFRDNWARVRVFDSED